MVAGAFERRCEGSVAFALTIIADISRVPDCTAAAATTSGGSSSAIVGGFRLTLAAGYGATATRCFDGGRRVRRLGGGRILAVCGGGRRRFFIISSVRGYRAQKRTNGIRNFFRRRFPGAQQVEFAAGQDGGGAFGGCGEAFRRATHIGYVQPVEEECQRNIQNISKPIKLANRDAI